MMIKSHHCVKRGVVNKGTGVERAVGGDLEQARDGDSLGLHQHLELGGIGSKFGKEGFRAEKERFEREMFPEEADGCCESFKILKWGSKTWLLQQGMQWPPSQQQT